MNVVPGGIFLTKGWEWASGIPVPERDDIIERILQLPGWVAGDPSAANLDVTGLEGAPGFYRLRVGRYRAIFQRLGMDVVLHGVDTRGAVYAQHRLRSLRFVRERSGLRLLAWRAQPHPEPGTSKHRRPAAQRAERPVQQNPLTVFSDHELAQLGLPAEAIDVIRRIPEQLAPDGALAPLVLDPELVAAVAELWENPAPHLAALSEGKALSLEALALPEDEAAARLRSPDSGSSVRPLTGESELASILERPIEDWMLFMHPAQERMVELSNDGPVRIRGSAGTGKTVVALHRARRLAATENGRVLLTTFVTTLPKVWHGLFDTFAPDLATRIDIRTVDAVAYDIYQAGGGWAEPAEESWRDAVVREVHADQPAALGGLSSLGLQDEFDYVITGRGLRSVEEYLSMPRTGRGSPLGEQARREVWRRYELYRSRLDDEAKYGWHEIRAEALQMLSAGEVRRRYAAVIADETQDLTETSVRLLVALAGGGARPAVTFVGDGQQSIYPGGFSLRSLGVEVRGRSFVLRTNWRNSYAIWLAASAFIAGEQFDDLEDELEERPPEDQPYPLRDGTPPRLHQLGTFDEATEWLAELVADDLAAGADPGDCAVLTPTNALATRLERALSRAAVTVRGLDRYAGEHSDSVWVGTFHRAKGLEFKRVYVLGLEAANWPPRVPGLESAAQSEADGRAVRAAFVAMTRARDSLDVVTTRERAPRLAEAAWAFDR
jgi:hypothetical protein